MQREKRRRAVWGLNDDDYPGRHAVMLALALGLRGLGRAWDDYVPLDLLQQFGVVRNLTRRPVL